MSQEVPVLLSDAMHERHFFFCQYRYQRIITAIRKRKRKQMLQQSAKNWMREIQGAYGHSMSINDALMNSLPCTTKLDLRAEYAPKGGIGFTGTVPGIRLSCLT